MISFERECPQCFEMTEKIGETKGLCLNCFRYMFELHKGVVYVIECSKMLGEKETQVLEENWK